MSKTKKKQELLVVSCVSVLCGKHLRSNLHRDVIRSCDYLVEHNLLSNSPLWIQGTKRSLWHSRLQSHIYYTSHSSHVHSWNKEVQKSKLQVCGVSTPWLHTAEAFPVTGSAFCSTSAPCSVILPRTAHYRPDLQATKNLCAHHTRWDVCLLNGRGRIKNISHYFLSRLLCKNGYNLNNSTKSKTSVVLEPEYGTSKAW